MKLRFKAVGLLAAIATLGITSLGNASSHREAPAIADDPAADNTDTWAWLSADRTKLYVVAAYVPLEEPSGGPNFHNFSDEVLYQVHIARGNTSLADVITYDIAFTKSPFTKVDPANLSAAPGGGKEFFYQLSGQTTTYSITENRPGVAPKVLIAGAPVAPVNAGPRTDSLASRTYNDAFAATFIKDLSGGGRAWAGPRDDGFYVDLGGVFDLANLRAKGTAQDGVSGFNCHAIALEIPTTQLTANGAAPAAGASNENTIGVWASASRRLTEVKTKGKKETFGPWRQVSRLGLPLINEAVIGLQDKDKFNASHPKDDVAQFGAYFLNPVIVRDAEAVGIYTALATDPTPFKSNRTDILDVINLKDNPTAGAHAIPLTATGDVLRVDLGVISSFPNGRKIGVTANTEEDVTDILLSVLLSKGAVNVKDGVDYNDKNYLATFPFLAAPHRGFDQGHGKPTP
jgi:hypothetical protein